MISVKDLLTPLTPAQVRTTMVSKLIALDVPADKWKQGGSLSTILTVLATVIAAFTTLLALALGAGFLETASGHWLTLVAHYIYGVDRPAATFATGKLTLTNVGGGIYDYLAGQATFADLATGKQYTNVADLHLAATSTLTIDIIATEAGSASSAAVGKVDTLVTFMLGVTCSNPTDVVGQDAMLDEPLKALCLAALGARSVRGPRTAYAYAVQVALNAVTSAPVNVNRWSVTPNSHTGHVGVVVASPAGVVSANDLTGVGTSIEAIARPDAVTVDLTGATTVAYTQAITVWCRALPGYTSSAVQDAVGAALLTYFEAYPIGGIAKGVAQGVWATGLDGVVTSSFAGVYAVDGLVDMALTAGQVATNGITIAVRFQ
jgi:hypothetical protein